MAAAETVEYAPPSLLPAPRQGRRTGSDGVLSRRGASAPRRGSVWRLIVESDRRISVMRLLESLTGHLMNVSTAPASGIGEKQREHGSNVV